MFTNVILLDLFNTLRHADVDDRFACVRPAGRGGRHLRIQALERLGRDDAPTAIRPRWPTVHQHGQCDGDHRSDILISVAIAFACGTVVMYVTRLIFTFRYHKVLRTRRRALVRYRLLGHRLLRRLQRAQRHAAHQRRNACDGVDGAPYAGSYCCACCGSRLEPADGAAPAPSQSQYTAKLTVLAGTFSLALAFAGNDLVNFIGVPVAGVRRLRRRARRLGDSPDMLMGEPERSGRRSYLGFLVPRGTRHGRHAVDLQEGPQRVSDTEINLATSGRRRRAGRFDVPFHARSFG